jgi:hypothetical protein
MKRTESFLFGNVSVTGAAAPTREPMGAAAVPLCARAPTVGRVTSRAAMVSNE